MYSRKQKQTAIETYFKIGENLRATIRILGYPNSRETLSNWIKDYRVTGAISKGYRSRKPRFSEEQMKAAVKHYFEHGCNIQNTIKRLGCPKCYQTLAKWIDEIAPGKRKLRTTKPRSMPHSQEIKIKAVADLETRSTTAKEVADRYEVTRVTPYIWRQELEKPHNEGNPNNRSTQVALNQDQLTKNVQELKAMEQDLRARVRALQLEEDVRKATLEIIKKSRAPTRTGSQTRRKLS